ncbi:MAG: transposase [Candidatus Muirbacterium halophilum]|nr:transposase [Candidatus Muirbacterium halophilum]
MYGYKNITQRNDKNHNLAKSIQELSLFEFRRQLEYKVKWYNRDLVFVDRFYPSSKTCSACGYINHDLTLKDGDYIYPDCGNIMNRDLNASIIILNDGLRLYNASFGTS